MSADSDRTPANTLQHIVGRAVGPLALALRRVDTLTKFVACGLVLLVPLTYVAIELRGQVSDDLEFVRDERRGVADLRLMLSHELDPATAGASPDLVVRARQTADDTRITLDPVLSTYYLGQILATDVPALIASLDDPTRAAATPAHHATQLAAHLRLSNPPEVTPADLLAAIGHLTRTAPNTSTERAAGWRTSALGADLVTIVETVARQLDHLLAQRSAEAASVRDRTAWVIAIGLMLSVYVLGALHASIAAPIARIKERLAAAGSGKFELAPPEPGNDELTDATQALDTALHQLRTSHERLERRASHDPLTDLPNRAALDALTRDPRWQCGWRAALFVDLDRFKLINDTYGHTIGDHLLTVVAVRLREAVRGQDVVGRLAGDEFLVLLQDVASPDEAAKIAERVLDGIKLPIGLRPAPVAQHIHASASIGVALLDPASPFDLDEMVRRSDIAMYEAKARGRGTIVSFEPELGARMEAKLTMRTELEAALETGAIINHYQPIIDTRTGLPVGIEALVRWEHPIRGVVSPDDFLPAAVDAGLMVQVGERVLLQACRDAADWRRVHGNLVVNVNLSTSEMVPGLVERVHNALDCTGLPASGLCLEVTEGALLADLDAAISSLDRLRRIGVRVSLDDFGTGYSSLSYLARLPVDELKIDRSFVKAMFSGGDESRTSTAIVAAVITLSETLGLATVVEGVETSEQLVRLAGLGAKRAQGFHLSRPCPADELPAALRRIGLRALETTSSRVALLRTLEG